MLNFLLPSNLFEKFLSILSLTLISSFDSMDDLGKIKYQFRKNKKNTTVVLYGVPTSSRVRQNSFKIPDANFPAM